MTFYELSIIATISATFTVMCVYFFLYTLYRQTYIGLWAFFWLIHFINHTFYRTPLHQFSIEEQIGIQLISTANYVLLVFATHQFLGRKMHLGWYYGAIIVGGGSVLAVFLDAPFLVKAFPPLAYISYVYFWHGWIFMKLPDKKGWGITFVCIAFFGLGIHTLDMPFLVTVNWFAPWGFLISGTLRFIIALGMLMLYMERNHRDLSVKEEQYRFLAENAADTIYLFKLKPLPKIDYVSPSITKLTGYNIADFSASPNLLFSLIHPNDLIFIEKLIADPVTASANPVTIRLIRRDHALLWVEQTTVPIFDDNGVCISFEGIMRDITARKALEQDVSRLDRLNTVGQMAANMAHEIRNPLTTVQGYLQFFLRKQAFTEYIDQFNLLISELDRANLIIKEYLSLCKNKSRDLKSCQLNCVIQDVYPLLKAAANASSKDVYYNPGIIPEIYLDEKEIRQLVLNLVRNGLEAMEAGGVVTIRTYAKKGKVVLAIQDQGKGVPQHILDNIGKPFLTTKENGTGLGLAVVYRIVSDHQASIEVDTNPQGTTFQVLFKTQ